MFEVGKKYYLIPYTNKVFECIWVDGDKAVLKNPNARWLHGGAFTTNLANFGGYKEHKEPRTITRWINVYEEGGELIMGPHYFSKENALKIVSQNNMSYRDTIPITYTEPH